MGYTLNSTRKTAEDSTTRETAAQVLSGPRGGTSTDHLQLAMGKALKMELTLKLQPTEGCSASTRGLTKQAACPLKQKYQHFP